MSTRVRFAPSPTGYHHLGNFRSALFNYLAARHDDGTFILRIEDTDRERLVPDAAKYLQDSLAWLGLDPDEGMLPSGDHGDFAPYEQSKRLDIYRSHADELVKSGALYPCWCSSERLDNLRKAAQKAGQAFKYDRHCLVKENQKSLDEPHVLRFRIPDERPGGGQLVAWTDLVLGELGMNLGELDDYVCLKSDGYPTYNFAVVIDDHLMQISHVLRGQEFVPTTPKNVLLYEAFGWDQPAWVHLPQVFGGDKTKLSKRHGAVPVLDYRDQGYLPEAVFNFLAALGWNEGSGSTKEIYTREELIGAFTLERIQKSPAIFDPERLLWLNGQYMRSLSVEALTERCEGFWPAEAMGYDTDYRQAVLGLVRERLRTLAELAEYTGFFFADPDYGDGVLATEAAKYTKPSLTECLEAVTETVDKSDFSESDLESRLRPLAEKLETKTGVVFGAVRLAVTGQKAAPGLFETLHVLGRETALRRLAAAQKQLS